MQGKCCSPCIISLDLIHDLNSIFTERQDIDVEESKIEKSRRDPNEEALLKCGSFITIITYFSPSNNEFELFSAVDLK